MHRIPIKRLLRSYPSLNLRINVGRLRNKVDVVLPGLRYDDLDNAGLPDIWRIYEMMSRVEFAAFYHQDSSYLDYTSLLDDDVTSITKAVHMDIRSSFYETTTPKAPLGISMNLSHIGKHSFMTTLDMSCAGKMTPSIYLRNIHAVVSTENFQTCTLPEWWLQKHKKNLTEPVQPYQVHPPAIPSKTFNHIFTVPLIDADIHGRTRCASYVRYFIENASIASWKDFYPQISTKFHNYCVKRITMLYFAPSTWGDTLISKTWEDESKLHTLHCNVIKNGMSVWYGCFEFHPEIFGLDNENIK